MKLVFEGLKNNSTISILSLENSGRVIKIYKNVLIKLKFDLRGLVLKNMCLKDKNSSNK